MDIKDNIVRLWRYLNIQDDTTLIVKAYLPERGKDVAIVATGTQGELNIEVSDTFPALDENMDFHIIEQRDSDGRYVIPSVERMIQDKNTDY